MLGNGPAALGFYSDVTASEPPGSHCNWRAKSRTGMFRSAYTWMSPPENRSEVVVTGEI
jgi:hypothetical protein